MGKIVKKKAGKLVKIAKPQANNLVKMETLSLRAFGINEMQLQDWLADEQSGNIAELGIPDVFVRDKERWQQHAGRVDFLLENNSHDKRYVVEVQLGKTDASHIIRTIEYWDLERQRFPRYNHCAVIVAEDITSRFFNVIGLFNRHIPVIAIKMTAVKQPNGVGLVFSHLLRETTAGEESDAPMEKVDRKYWVTNKGELPTSLAEYICGKLGVTPRFTRGYVGVNDAAAFLRNRLHMHEKGGKKKIRLYFTMQRTTEWDEIFEEGFNGKAISVRAWSRKGLYLVEFSSKKEIDSHLAFLRALYYDASQREQTEIVAWLSKQPETADESTSEAEQCPANKRVEEEYDVEGSVAELKAYLDRHGLHDRYRNAAKAVGESDAAD